MCASLAHAPGHIYKCIYIRAYILALPMWCRCRDVCTDVHHWCLIHALGQGLPEMPHMCVQYGG